MDFRDLPEDAAFRREVREFLVAERPKGFGRPRTRAGAGPEGRERDCPPPRRMTAACGVISLEELPCQ